MVKQKAKAKPKKPSVPRKPKVKKPKVEKVKEPKPPKKKDVIDKLYRERLLRAKGSLGPRSAIFGPKETQPVLPDKRFDEKLDYLYKMLLLAAHKPPKPQRPVPMDISESEARNMSDVDPPRVPVFDSLSQQQTSSQQRTRGVERSERVERKSAARDVERKQRQPTTNESDSDSQSSRQAHRSSQRLLKQPSKKSSASQTQTSSKKSSASQTRILKKQSSGSQTQTLPLPPEANQAAAPNRIPFSVEVLDANQEEMKQRSSLNLPRAPSPPIVPPAPSLSLLSPDPPDPVSMSLLEAEPAAPPRKRNIRVIRDPDNLIELISGRKPKTSKVYNPYFEGEFSYTTPSHLPSSLVARSERRTSQRARMPSYRQSNNEKPMFPFTFNPPSYEYTDNEEPNNDESMLPFINPPITEIDRRILSTERKRTQRASDQRVRTHPYPYQ